MRGFGKGVKSFKDGVNEAKEEINKAKEDLEKPAEKNKRLYYLTIYELLFATQARSMAALSCRIVLRSPSKS